MAAQTGRRCCSCRVCQGACSQCSRGQDSTELCTERQACITLAELWPKCEMYYMRTMQHVSLPGGAAISLPGLGLKPGRHTNGCVPFVLRSASLQVACGCSMHTNTQHIDCWDRHRRVKAADPTSTTDWSQPLHVHAHGHSTTVIRWPVLMDLPGSMQ
jgi:hypothetical protein